MRPVKIMIRLRVCAGGYGSSLGAHIQRYFFTLLTYVYSNTIIKLVHENFIAAPASWQGNIINSDNHCIVYAALKLQLKNMLMLGLIKTIMKLFNPCAISLNNKECCYHFIRFTTIFIQKLSRVCGMHVRWSPTVIYVDYRMHHYVYARWHGIFKVLKHEKYDDNWRITPRV